MGRFSRLTVSTSAWLPWATVVNYTSPSWTCYLSFVGSSSQTVKDEGRGSGQPGEILGLKRPYDLMEGGISRGLPMRDSLSVANCEGKTFFHSYLLIAFCCDHL